MKKNIEAWKKDLQNILNDAIISPKLRTALEEALKALKDSNWNLTYQLTVVKSYVTGNIDPKDKVHAFQEDHKANEKILGKSVYSTVDDIHHAIAFFLKELPSGMMVAGKSGTVQSMKPQGTHPILRRIKWEHQQIVRGTEK